MATTTIPIFSRLPPPLFLLPFSFFPTFSFPPPDENPVRCLQKRGGAVYCTADEAALCDSCDHRVHHANKLASKHLRFSLLPDPKSFPLCDVCQEKWAFVFCQQDRAILCKDCYVSIHSVNEFTHHHNRFLLTRVKLSPNSQLYISPSSSAASPNLVPCITASTKSTPLKKPGSLSVDIAANSNNHVGQAANNSFSSQNSTAAIKNNRVEDHNNNNNNSVLITGVGGGYGGSVHSSSISEYLIDTIKKIPTETMGLLVRQRRNGN